MNAESKEAADLAIDGFEATCASACTCSGSVSEVGRVAAVRSSMSCTASCWISAAGEKGTRGSGVDSDNTR